MLAGEAYYGKHGYSLRLDGLDPRFNGAAYRRDIVIHSAWYVGKAFAEDHGRMGRSWGCFALSPRVESAVVRLIRGGTVLVGYYPDPAWLRSSPFLGTAAAESTHGPAHVGRSTRAMAPASSSCLRSCSAAATPAKSRASRF